MNVEYWHELTPEQQKEIIQSGITLGETLEKYKQPPWCGYHEALNPIMGCWSLTDGKTVINEDFCETCDLHIHNIAKFQEENNK